MKAFPRKEMSLVDINVATFNSKAESSNTVLRTNQKENLQKVAIFSSFSQV